MGEVTGLMQKENPSGLTINSAKDLLTVSFGDVEYAFSAEFLRVQSPSAEVRGHSESERKTVGGKRNVKIESVKPVGNYAVRIGFDDGHSSGIYSWEFFRENGADMDAVWQTYLGELAAKNMDRDTPQMV